MMALVEILFWFSLVWIAYVFAGYPLLMAVLARVRSRPLATRPGYQPSIALVMAAYNEEKIIRQRLQNYLELDYPRELLSFYIGSDGSTDATDDIIREFQAIDPSIHLSRFNRCGKTRIIYELAEDVTADLIVFTDADVLLDRDALRIAARCFSDPDVGGVIGRVDYLDRRRSVGSSGERKFIEIEDSLRRNESLVWTTVAPTGQCFPVRRGSYTPLTDYRLSDDLNLSITISMNGKRVWYEPDFVIHEMNKRTIGTEMRRRLRMGQQSTATYLANPGTRFPWRSLAGFEVWSHKLLRNLAAIPATLLFVTSLILAEQSWLYCGVAIASVAWGVILLVGFLCDQLKLNIPVLLYPLYFTTMVASLTVGSVRAAFSGGLEMWNSQRLE